jgi:hypothetical protein
MQQVFHIFKKDVRYLRIEIGLMLTLMALFASLGAWWAEFLIVFTAGYLIARVVQAEAIPGDNQFWLTRPYGWRTLMGAKVLFILTFVNLPICLAQLAIVLIAGFPIGAVVGGLLWSQVLFIFLLSLPVVALAVLTRGILPFLLSALIMFTLYFSSSSILGLRVNAPWPGAVLWTRDTTVVGLTVAAAMAIVFLQYRSRQTRFSRVLAVAALIVVLATYTAFPLSTAFAVQSRMSKQPFDATSLGISVDRPAKQLFLRWKAKEAAEVPVHLPIKMENVPPGMDLRADLFLAGITTHEGRHWESTSRHPSAVSMQTLKETTARIETTMFVDRSFYDSLAGQSVTIHGSLFLTAFGNLRSETIPLQDKPVNLRDGMQCYLGVFEYQVMCRSAFRWPSRLIYSQFNSSPNPFRMMISYSPFPAELGLNPLETHWASGTPSGAREVTIVSKEPVSYIRRDFDIPGISLSDLTAPPGGREK